MGLFSKNGILSKIPGAGSLLSGGNGLGILNDVVPGLSDKAAQDAANKQNLQLDQMNRDWQERMSNSAYQRAMDDMKKAGLNPILAYQQGGSSVPNTTAPQVGAASASALGSTALAAFTGISAAQSQRQQADTAQAQSQSAIALQGSQSAQAIATTQKTEAETAKTIDSIKDGPLRRKLMSQQATLGGVKSSAAEMANKGISTLERISNNVLKNTAKPKVNPKTLQYEKPWYEKVLSSPSQNLKQHIKGN